MLETNITGFRKDIYQMIRQTILYNEPLNIRTKDGNAVLMSEEDYRGLMETVYLMSIPGMQETLLEGMQTPLSDCIPEEEIDW